MDKRSERKEPGGPEAELDGIDKAILNLIQSGFPLASRPYAVIGERAGIGEAEALERVRDLRRRGIIRRIGANFSSAGLGWHSTLCAARVTEDRLDHFVATVNALPGVTHNYLRDHQWNVWFTLIAESREKAGDILAEIHRTTGIEILNLPAERLYKIKVDFRMD